MIPKGKEAIQVEKKVVKRGESQVASGWKPHGGNIKE